MTNDVQHIIAEERRRYGRLVLERVLDIIEQGHLLLDERHGLPRDLIYGTTSAESDALYGRLRTIRQAYRDREVYQGA